VDYRKFETLEFSPTTYCQAKCPLCPRTELDAKDKLVYRHFSLETYKKMVDTAPSAVEVIYFCGDYGDPLMHPDIEEMIDYGCASGKEVQVATNGGLRQKDWYVSIAKRWKDQLRLNFGIDGITAEQSSKYRIEVDFNRAWEHMIAANESGAVVCWDFLVFTFNYRSVPEAIELARKNKLEMDIKLNTRDWKYKIVDKEMKEQVFAWANKVSEWKWYDKDKV